MQLRVLVLGSVCLAAFAFGAQACPDHAPSAGAAKSASLAPRTAPASPLVAWKPRAWRPAGAPVAQGLRVAIDPVDGTLGMPEPGQFDASAGVGEEDLRPVSMIRRANGSGRAQLDERWESHAVASIGPDGKLRWTCVDGSGSAARFMKNPVIPATPVQPAAPVWEEK